MQLTLLLSHFKSCLQAFTRALEAQKMGFSPVRC